MENYKDIRNSLLFSYFDYSLHISGYTIKNEIKRIEEEIRQEIIDDEIKLKTFKEKIIILSFYSTVEIDNLGINAAACKDS